MSESKHTPGPWEAGPIDIQTGSVGVFGKRYEGCEIAIVWGDPDSSVTADAALIAAAPDLLEAAEWISTLIYQQAAENGGVHPTYPGSAAHHKLLAAIDKANRHNPRTAIARVKGDSEGCSNCDGNARPSCPLCDGTNRPFPEEQQR